MKKVISVVLLIVLLGTVAFAQNQKQKKNKGNDWREKVRSEQVAMITSELQLTEAEAQTFWPVYNAVQNERREAFKASQNAFKALQEGLEGKEVESLLENYINAKKATQLVEENAVKKYKAVLPADKVARLLLTEEKFRHQQIGRLGQGGGPGGRPGGGRTPMGGRPPMGGGMDFDMDN